MDQCNTAPLTELRCLVPGARAAGSAARSGATYVVSVVLALADGAAWLALSLFS